MDEMQTTKLNRKCAEIITALYKSHHDQHHTSKYSITLMRPIDKLVKIHQDRLKTQPSGPKQGEQSPLQFHKSALGLSVPAP